MHTDSFFIPAVSRYFSHPITRDFKIAAIFPIARSLGEAKEEKTKGYVQFLAATSANSFGETDKETFFVSNQALFNSGNRDLFLNSVNWLADEESIISISRPKKADFSPVLISARQSKMILYGVVIGPVFFVFIIGAFVVIGRLRKWGQLPIKSNACQKEEFP